MMVKKFVRMPVKRKQLSYVAIAVLYALCSYAGNETGACWPSKETVAKFVGMSVPTVSKGIRELADKHYIAVEHRFDPETRSYLSNLYTILYEPIRGLQRGSVTRKLAKAE